MDEYFAKWEDLLPHVEDSIRLGELPVEYKFDIGSQVIYKGRRMLVKQHSARHPRATEDTPQLYVLQFPDRDATRLAWENEIEACVLVAIETSLDPDSFAYIRLLFPDATGVQVLPSYGVQDYNEAAEIVKAAYPDAQIVTPHELNQEVERRQPDVTIPEEYFEAEF